MWGKRYYSRALTAALLNNGALALDSWPVDLATPAEAELYWPYRIAVNNYPALLSQAPNLRVMLVFCRDDHVQTAVQKAPHSSGMARIQQHRRPVGPHESGPSLRRVSQSCLCQLPR